MITQIIETQGEVDQISGRLMNDALRNGIIVFDSEFNMDGSVAVVQLMPTRHRIYIIRTSMLSQFPEIVKTILMDSRIIKVGHSLESDERAMMRNHGFRIRSKLDIRHLIMRLRIKIPSMGRKSNLKGLMDALVPEIPNIDLNWWEKVNWNHLNPRKIMYIQGDVQGVFEICAKLMKVDRLSDLRWTTFQGRILGIEDCLDRDVSQQSWFIFNCQ
jgi:ribonuclease D